MNKTISLAIAGFGAALFLLAVIVWFGNRPDFEARLASACSLTTSRGSERFQRCMNDSRDMADESTAAYNSCLFSFRYGGCPGGGMLPFLSIGGILVIALGTGLFLYAERREA